MSFQIIQNDWSLPGSTEAPGISAARPWQPHRVCILSVEFNTRFFHVRLFIGEQPCQCRWEANWCVRPLEELRLQPQLGTTEFYSRKEAFEVVLPGVCLNTRSLSPIRCNLSMARGMGRHSAPAPCQLKAIIFMENDESIFFLPKEFRYDPSIL